MLIDNDNKSNIIKDDKSDSTCGSATNLKKLLMSISAFSLQGRRSHMEDFFDIGYQMKPEECQKPGEWPYEYFYFGIFDGHGGSEAAKFVKENLLKLITKQSDFWSENDEDILRSIQRGFAESHEEMRKIMHNWPRTHKYLPSTAGTTASILFIKNGKYYTGHVGDSRIVISRRDDDSKQWISQQLTEDHKPESQAEIDRIRRAGGDVKTKVGVHRVVWRRPVLNPEFDSTYNYVLTDGVYKTEYRIERADEIASYPIKESFVRSYQIIPFLAIARSLGDFWSINPYSGQYIVSPEPDVSCRPIHPNDECILLATDGLWSVVNSQQAIRALEEFKAVRESERNGTPLKDQYFYIDNFYNVTRPSERDNYALSLVYLANQVWERRSLRSDNITAVVAMLGDILQPQKATASKRLYRTRSNTSIVKEGINTSKPTENLIEGDIIQIGQTRSYNEILQVDVAPTFKFDQSESYDINSFERLSDWLRFPPYATPEVPDVTLIPPRNWARFDKAEVRVLHYPNENDDLLIKRVSDDPMDEVSQPERPGRKPGVMVRDASAQCTQSIYDFSLPWICIYDDDNQTDRYDLPPDDETEKFDITMFDLADDDDDDNDHLDDEDEGLDEEDEIEDCDHHELVGDDDDGDSPDRVDKDDVVDPALLIIDSLDFDVWNNKSDNDELSKPNTRRSSRESLENKPKDHMLQPRSENCEESPKYRRRTRSGAYLSLTGGPKRKVLHDSPKSKRRKSHPLQCALAHS